MGDEWHERATSASRVPITSHSSPIPQPSAPVPIPDDRKIALQPTVSTVSMVARDLETGELGIAVASKFLAVGAVVPWLRAGAGAVATQAHANVAYGPDGLAMLEDGLTAQEALDRLVAADA